MKVNQWIVCEELMRATNLVRDAKEVVNNLRSYQQRHLGYSVGWLRVETVEHSHGRESERDALTPAGQDVETVLKELEHVRLHLRDIITKVMKS